MAKTTEDLRLLSRQDVADLLKMSLRKVDMLREEGKIQAYKIDGQVRFKLTEISAYIESNKEVLAQ